MATNEQWAAYYEAMAESCWSYALAADSDAAAAQALPEIEESDRAARVAQCRANAASYRQSAEMYDRLAEGRNNQSAPAPSVTGPNQPGATQ